MIHKENSEPLTLRFFGDELEEIEMREIKLPSLQLYSRKEIDIEQEHPHMKYVTLQEILASKNFLHIIGDTLLSQSRSTYFTLFAKYTSIDILGEYNSERNVIKLPYVRPHCKSLEELQKLLRDTAGSYTLYTKHTKLLAEFLSLNTLHHVELRTVEHPLTESFCYGTQIVLCDDILSSLFIKKRSKKKLSQDIDLLLKIQA